MIFDELFKEYIELMTPLQSLKEIYNKKNRYENHIINHIGMLDLDNIKYKHCQEIVNRAIEKGKSPKTAKNINAIVQTIFNYAIRNEYCDRNPATAVIIPKFDNKYNIDLSDEDIKNLIDAILNLDNPIYKSMFIFALHGRRLSEVLSLQWYQIDFSMRIYHIPHQKNKAKKHDIHMMTDLLFDSLQKQYLDNSQFDMVNKNDYVFINPKTLTKYVDIRKVFNKIKDEANIKSFRFHDFRHLLATYTVNKKKQNIEHISYALGHSSIEVTQRYITKDFSISKNICDSFLGDFLND